MVERITAKDGVGRKCPKMGQLERQQTAAGNVDLLTNSAVAKPQFAGVQLDHDCPGADGKLSANASA